ncbi:hypothetical protein QWZ03_06070 [Chitinimonas viridis]|uniref:DNA gyrase subunit B n=1 Tax=Chitinimonas viridis TaxID=664880 RepID=A0ABT8B4B0_9NEIS|nr:hypothetical protein [Chitinimonas viridis]MDN3576329.1 hypothetical protein [Chitinimonas viridis]
MSASTRVRAVAVGLLTLSYPVLVYLGLGRFEPRWLALLLAGLALLRAIATRQPTWLAAAAGALLLALVTVVGNHALPLKLYPVLVNAVLLVVFCTSLIYPPSVIERLARLQEPDLPPEGVVYTRKVTQVWCGFFVLNGSIALVTALWASDAVWALYNGLIAYCLMGMLFAAEWLVRRRVRAGVIHG